MKHELKPSTAVRDSVHIHADTATRWWPAEAAEKETSAPQKAWDVWQLWVSWMLKGGVKIWKRQWKRCKLSTVVFGCRTGPCDSSCTVVCLGIPCPITDVPHLIEQAVVVKQEPKQIVPVLRSVFRTSRVAFWNLPRVVRPSQKRHLMQLRKRRWGSGKFPWHVTKLWVKSVSSCFNTSYLSICQVILVFPNSSPSWKEICDSHSMSSGQANSKTRSAQREGVASKYGSVDRI